MEAELIPGLPEYVALNCLLHLPFHAIPNARAVCKRWKHELDSPSFYRIRNATGFQNRVVSLLLRGKLPRTVGKFYLALYEPESSVFTLRQLAPNRPNFKTGNSHATVFGRELVVIGGWDVLKKCRTGDVNIYDLFSGTWRRGTPKPAPERCHCTYGIKGGKAFVIGGKDAEGKRLRSALAYDVAVNMWLEVPDLEQDTCQGTFIDGNKFWQSREEYNSDMEWCRKLLLSEDEEDVSLRMSEDERSYGTVFSAILKYKKERLIVDHGGELIPGLSEYVALDCLLHLPFHAIPNARAVCKRWKHELDSPSFYRIRKTADFQNRVVSLLLRGKLPRTVGKFYLALYEPESGVFTLRQLAPNRPKFKTGNSHATVFGRELVVIGGWDVLKKRRTGDVNIYDLLSGTWRRGTPKPAPERCHCTYGFTGGKVFVIGGKDVGGKRLRSALAYDVAINTWLEVPDLEQDTCQGTFIDSNKFWQSREEYNSDMEWCRKLLLSEDEEDVSLRMSEDERSYGKVLSAEAILSKDALKTLWRRLGLLPNEVNLHVECYSFRWL